MIEIVVCLAIICVSLYVLSKSINAKPAIVLRPHIEIPHGWDVDCVVESVFISRGDEKSFICVPVVDHFTHDRLELLAAFYTSLTATSNPDGYEKACEDIQALAQKFRVSNQPPDFGEHT